MKDKGGMNRKLIEDEVLKRCGITCETHILCAFSGGPDSTALLIELKRLYDEHKIGNLAAAHYEHGIRGKESEEDLEFCKMTAERLGIAFFQGKGNVPEFACAHKLSLETAARTLRYDFLKKVAIENGFDRIALAHHAMDQAETVLMHLIRGSGLKGLTGMKESAGFFFRPLISVPKEEILTFLHERRESFRTDSSNLDDSSSRNYLRLHVIPLLETVNSSAAVHIAEAASRLQRDDEYLDGLAEELIQQTKGKPSLIVLQHEVMQRRMLLKMLREYTDDYSEQDVEKLMQLLHASSGSKTCLTGGFTARNEGDEIRLFRNEPVCHEGTVSVDTPFEWAGGTLIMETFSCAHVPCPGNEAYVDGDVLKGSLLVRAFRPGERFTPFGSGHSKLFSDYFTDLKIPLSKRKGPVVFDENGVVYVCGYTVDDRVKVTDKTKRIIHFVYQEGDCNGKLRC